jgi:hypothetical protein
MGDARDILVAKIMEAGDHFQELSLFLTEHHAMKAYWEWRYSSTHS